MKPQNQVTVRSSETGLVFRMNRAVAERHDTLTILDGAEAVEAESEQRYDAADYNDLRAEVARRELNPTSNKAADLIAALVADDKEN
jgi:hypothetical protein